MANDPIIPVHQWKFIDGYDLTCDNCNVALETHADGEGRYGACSRFALSPAGVVSLVAHINTLAEFVEAKFPDFNGRDDEQWMEVTDAK